MQKLGQHFLSDKKYLQKIAASLEISDNDTVIEVGPGHGELTVFLAKTCAEKNNTSLVLIEKDKSLVAGLEKQNFQLPIFNFHLSSNDSIPKQKIALIEGDALKILQTLTENCKLKIENFTSWKLVGNIPYYITGRLLRAISELEPKPKLCLITIQKEVAERLIAKPPRMNLLAASVQIWAEPTIIATIPAHAFNPPPKVESAVIKLRTKNLELGTEELINYYKMLHVLFKQPRKTILNNLADGLGKSKSEIGEKLEKIGVKPTNRSQDLQLENLLELSRAFAALL